MEIFYLKWETKTLNIFLTHRNHFQDKKKSIFYHRRDLQKMNNKKKVFQVDSTDGFRLNHGI